MVVVATMTMRNFVSRISSTLIVTMGLYTIVYPIDFDGTISYCFLLKKKNINL